MVEILTVLIYCGCFLAGLLVGVLVVTRKYQSKVLDILEYLYFSKKMDKEEYEHYKEKYVVKQDSLRNINETIKKFRKGKVAEK